MAQDLVERLFSVAGKVTLITGGSSGLGLMMAEAYLRAGARVYITGRKQDQLAAARAELSAHGDVHAIQGDVARPEGIEAIIDALRNEARLDVLINNAGTTWGAPLEKFPAAAWDSVMAVNVKAPFMLVQALLPRLQAAASDAEPARVINIGSIYGVSTHVLTAWSYAASKSAIHQLTAVLAAELAPHRILVNAIAPGFFPSKMTRFVLNDEQRRDEMLQLIPLGRAGGLEDIGGLALYLGSRASAYMTGNIIPLDGGVLANR
jgi:NAD(P)-dependent dehydrogenase (short-subunit alcohol dehydrogenase family)